MSSPLLTVRSLTKMFGTRPGCVDINFELAEGEVLAVVGESGSGKTTLLRACSGRAGNVDGSVLYRERSGELTDVASSSRVTLRRLERGDWGFVSQDATENLRLNVSAGANIAERLMDLGSRNYGTMRAEATRWLDRVEIPIDRIDDVPRTFSGGMRQRLQVARTLSTDPRLVFLDEPTGGLDVSVQARLLDLLRGLVYDLGLAAMLVTHDLSVARLLSHQVLVMRSGSIVEAGLTDRVFDDPQHPYTQLLVSSVLAA